MGLGKRRSGMWVLNNVCIRVGSLRLRARREAAQFIEWVRKRRRMAKWAGGQLKKPLAIIQPRQRMKAPRSHVTQFSSTCQDERFHNG
eukprot:scaffold121877_cov34-Tisochrysis_lutea.AAC.1